MLCFENLLLKGRGENGKWKGERE